MKEIKLVTHVAIDFFNNGITDEVTKDLCELIGSIGHEKYPFYLDWSDDTWSPNLKAWLVKTYGEKIKEHEEFILISC